MIYNSRNLIVFIDHSEGAQNFVIYNSRNLIVFIDVPKQSSNVSSTIVEI